MHPDKKTQSIQLLTKSDTKPNYEKKGSSCRQKILRQSILLHKRLGTILFVLPIIWYSISGTLIVVARDLNLKNLHLFFQTWHSFQPVNDFTYQSINSFVAFSLLAQFISGLLILKNTRGKKYRKYNLNTSNRKCHRIFSPIFGSVGVVFAVTGWTNVILRYIAPESIYQLSRSIHNSSWFNSIWLCECYNIICGLGLTFLAVTGLFSIKRKFIKN